MIGADLLTWDGGVLCIEWRVVLALTVALVLKWVIQR